MFILEWFIEIYNHYHSLSSVFFSEIQFYKMICRIQYMYAYMYVCIWEAETLRERYRASIYCALPTSLKWLPLRQDGLWPRNIIQMFCMCGKDLTTKSLGCFTPVIILARSRTQNNMIGLQAFWIWDAGISTWASPLGQK